MSDLKTLSDAGNSGRRRPWSLILLIAGTVAVVLGLSVLHLQADFLNERYELDPAIKNLVTMLLTLVTVLAWAIWTFFFAKQRLLGLSIICIPVVLLALFYPNVNGDMFITGWKPRFWKTNVDYAVATNESRIDLSSTSARDFPQFLGIGRDGKVSGLELRNDWQTSPPKLLWNQPVGEGWSGFAAVNGYAVTQEQRGALECVTCYQIESGDLVWIHESKRRHEDVMAMGKVGPRATPTIDEGRVYCTSGTGVLDCLQGATGELLWSADVPALVGIDQISYTNGLGLSYTVEDSQLAWGRAGSPLIFNDLVIVPAGGPKVDEQSLTSTLIAFDKRTGAEVWRGGQRMVAYGSPSFAMVLGQPQILLVAEDQAVGHDPETGVELWSHERSGSSSADANCSQVTLVSDSKLLLSKGYNMGGELIELSRSGNQSDSISVESIFRLSRVLKTKLTSPVVYQDHAYSLSDGYLECTNLERFERKWKQRGRFGNGQLLLIGDKLLVHTENGQLLLIAADPEEYRELGSIDTIDGTCWNTLCLYGNQLLVRSDVEAACFELPTLK